MENSVRVLVVSLVLVLASGVGAAPTVFVVPLDGAQEVPGPGDPDGTGTAVLAIDPATLTIDWNITVSNIDLTLTGVLIHEAPAGFVGPVVVNFLNQLSGTGLVDPDLAAILANPTGFYVNIHNASFPAGAIRGQIPPVPAPSALGLAAFGLASLRFARRKPV